MAGLDAGQKFPAGTTFSYIPYTEEKSDINTSGSPIDFDASKEFAGKKVVLFAVPGAFTGTCSQSHLPGYIQNLAKFKELGVDSIVCIAYNDAYVMSAWGKANRVKGNDILFLSDLGTAFSKTICWTRGERADRYAMIIDDNNIVYAEREPAKGVTVSSAESVLAKLKGLAK